MRHYHKMGFGAEPQDDGRIKFRLWAPGARQVELCVIDGAANTFLAMSVEPEGWYSLVTSAAAVGSGYQYRIDGAMLVPDPASRCQLADVHGPSQVIDPRAWQWRDDDWRGRPWHEAVIYELHVGTFSPEGNFAGVKQRLDYLRDLGITAIELMPVADFPGARNWGYDGVLPFAPDGSYGSPGDLKDLVQTAHHKGLMVMLDVVYNHFGPEGNYLHAYAPQFFTERHHTPWGAAINFDGPDSRTVRDFFIDNALYWLEEYRFDGLRLDAVHAILDDSTPDVLQELAAAVRAGPGRDREIHLVLENDHNASRYLSRDDRGRPQHYDAQWNDDIHHAFHILLTGESDGYYADYAERPAWYLGRCLTEGFAYQGEPSPYRDGMPRGESSGALPPGAFVNFLQTHDQVGNRAFGERIADLAESGLLRAAAAVLLLAPSPPLLFMGEEFAAAQPFLFFCDFGADLAAAVTAGRRREFARFARFSDPASRERIPDPNAQGSFQRSKLDWSQLQQPQHKQWLTLYRELLSIRQREIVPRLDKNHRAAAGFRLLGERGLMAHWDLADGAVLRLIVNLGEDTLALPERPAGRLLYSSEASLADLQTQGRIPGAGVAWLLGEGGS
jgi:malto-oligosyltrehalose trehalohydrolase